MQKKAYQDEIKEKKTAEINGSIAFFDAEFNGIHWYDEDINGKEEKKIVVDKNEVLFLGEFNKQNQQYIDKMLEGIRNYKRKSFVVTGKEARSIIITTKEIKEKKEKKRKSSIVEAESVETQVMPAESVENTEIVKNSEMNENQNLNITQEESTEKVMTEVSKKKRKKYEHTVYISSKDVKVYLEQFDNEMLRSLIIA